MKPARRTLSVLGIVFAASTAAGVAAADQPRSRSIAERASASATVEKIDAGKRELSLRDDRGHMFMVQVPESVTRFDAIKKGDRVDVDYYQSVTLSLTKPGETAQPGAHEQATVERSAGQLPGGLMARRITAAVEVMNVDRAEHEVTIRGPNGEIDTIHVADPALQADLGKLKSGDRIEVSYTEALALSVTPKEKP